VILINSFTTISNKLAVPFVLFLYRFITYKILNSPSPYSSSKLLFYSRNRFKFSDNSNKINYYSSLLLFYLRDLNIVRALSII
jgi:hypothetical protein